MPCKTTSVIVAAVLGNLIVAVAGSSCSKSVDLHRRIAEALTPDGKPTPSLNSLRGHVDNVLSADDSRFLREAIAPSQYVAGSGYNDNQYSASEVGKRSNIAGLELSQLANPETGFATKQDYERFLKIREKILRETERSLGLCHGTLRIDFTHLTMKGKGGQHSPHADNCFHYFENGRPKIVHHLPHPYSTRVAANIVFINDDRSFGGGEFYWADLETGNPAVLVKPKSGRMAYFTAGIENLHGALPVEDVKDDDHGDEKCNSNGGTSDCESEATPPRRLYIAMWYVDRTQPAEIVPEYRSNGDHIQPMGDPPTDRNDPNAPIKVLEIPIKAKKGGLRVALSFFLLGLQNEPSKGTWRFVQQDDVPLGMIFKDESAMFSIGLGDESITIERHADPGKRPSLFYQLQESIILHKVLDELNALAFGKGDDGQDIADDDRLLLLRGKDAIDEVRKKLPARGA